MEVLSICSTTWDLTWMSETRPNSGLAPLLLVKAPELWSCNYSPSPTGGPLSLLGCWAAAGIMWSMHNIAKLNVLHLDMYRCYFCFKTSSVNKQIFIKHVLYSPGTILGAEDAVKSMPSWSLTSSWKNIRAKFYWAFTMGCGHCSKHNSTNLILTILKGKHYCLHTR